MNSYSLLVCLHVITAILGLGPLTALAVATTWSPSTPSTPFPYERIVRLMQIVGWSLLGLLVTGCVIIAMTHGALGETRWMRISFGLFVVLGFLHGMSRRLLRRAHRATPPAPLPKLFGRILWAMCTVVATITYLMEAKPW
jgi:hypothetical protein